jgi:hypothetical protein
MPPVVRSALLWVGRAGLLATGSLGGCEPGPREVSDCLPTLGNHCSCEPQCLTERQIEQVTAGGVCELACPQEAEALDWACTIVEGECAVAPVR